MWDWIGIETHTLSSYWHKQRCLAGKVGESELCSTSTIKSSQNLKEQVKTSC